MFYLMTHSTHFIYGYMASDMVKELFVSQAHHVFSWKRKKEGERKMFYLMTHSTHFIYGYMASDMVKELFVSQAHHVFS